MTSIKAAGKWIKYLTVAALLLLVLVAVSLPVLLWLDQDLRHTRQQLVMLFEQHTGHKLQIGGELRIQLWPRPRLVVEQVVLEAPGQPAYFRAGRLLLDANWQQLFGTHPQFTHIRLEQVDIYLQRNAAGQLQLRQEPTNTTADAAAGTEAGVEASGGPGPLVDYGQLPFQLLEIENATLHYRDLKEGGSRQLEQLSLSVDNRPGQPAQLSAQGFLVDISGRRSRVELDGSAHFTAPGLLSADNMRLKVAAEPAGRVMDLSLSASFNASLDGEYLHISQARLQSEALQLDAVVQADYQPAQSQGRITVKHFNPSALLALWEQSVSLPENETLRYFNAELVLNVRNGQTVIDIPVMVIDETQAQANLTLQHEQAQLQLKVDRIDLQPYLALLPLLDNLPKQQNTGSTRDWLLNVQVNHLLTGHGQLIDMVSRVDLSEGQLQSLSGSLKLENVNLSALLRQHAASLPLPAIIDSIPDNDVFTHLQGNLQYQLDGTSVSVDRMDLLVDETRLRGDFEYRFSPPAIFSQLSIGKLNLDRYAALFKVASSVEKPMQPGWSESQRAWLEALDGEGYISIDSLRHAGVDYTDIRLDFSDGEALEGTISQP